MTVSFGTVREQPVIQASFQIAPRVGPTRERRLWDAGVHEWSALPMRGLPAAGVSEKLAANLLEVTARMHASLAARDLPALAARLPHREHWRLLGAFLDEAVFLDIETDAEEGVTVIGLLLPDRFGGCTPRVLLAGRDLDEFPDLMESVRLLVTYNGASFDVPILARAFPGWRPPPVHVDLRPLWARLGHVGGLKLLEAAEGLARPHHLRGIGGWDIMSMWRHARRGDARALRLLVEYNLYDAVGLRTLAALGYNRMLERLALPGIAPMHVAGRGDVLYDVTKALLAVA